jgi:hypothetical protein
MDWATRLAKDTLAQLEQRARNANQIIQTQPDSPRAAEAKQLLDSIEKERAHRSLPGNIASFLDKYPLGFKDLAYLKAERDDKVAASQKCQQALSIEAFAQSEPGELIDSVRHLVNMTNLIQGSFEKPKLLDAIKDPSNSAAFVGALKGLLHGQDEVGDRLERFSDYLHTLGLRKWTYGTYFLFLHDPAHCTFVKPEGLKKAVEITGYPVNYDPAPSARVYNQVIEFAKWIWDRLSAQGNADLVPKDMIDVQSFIWHMAPTGKFARE